MQQPFLLHQRKSGEIRKKKKTLLLRLIDVPDEHFEQQISKNSDGSYWTKLSQYSKLNGKQHLNFLKLFRVWQLAFVLPGGVYDSPAGSRLSDRIFIQSEVQKKRLMTFWLEIPILAMSHGLSDVGRECVLVYHSAKRSLRLNVSFKSIISSKCLCWNSTWAFRSKETGPNTRWGITRWDLADRRVNRQG